MAVYALVLDVQGTVECVIQIDLCDVDVLKRGGMFVCVCSNGSKTSFGLVEVTSSFSTLLGCMSMNEFMALLF